MNISSFTADSEFIKDNKLTNDAALMLSTMILQLQHYLPDDGYIQASVDSRTISQMEKKTIGDTRNEKYYQPKMVHDSDKNAYKLNNLQGKFETIQTKFSAYDSSKPWVNPSTGLLTQDAIDYLNNLIEA